MNYHPRTDSIRLPCLYLACCLTVISYANAYILYEHLVNYLGINFVSFAPFIPPVLFMLFFICVFSIKQFCIQWRWFLLGTSLCIFALLLPDPRIAVKRIHVSEYVLLSLLVRYTLSYRLAGFPLLLFSILFTAILGIHDEFIQGLHPYRTYGLMDITVNGIAGAGGSFIWHSMRIFVRNTERTAPASRAAIIHYLYLGWLIIAVLAMIVPLPVFLNHRIPFWPFLPLAATVALWVCFLQQDDSEFHHGLIALSISSFLFLAIPPLVNSLEISFY